MRTPKHMADAIKNQIITDEILGACAYSCNKRAKNCRDKIREYREKYYSHEKYTAKYREDKARYYSMKDTLLSVASPVCVHVENVTKPVYNDGDYMEQNSVERYYLYYKVGDYSFHRPIDKENIPADLTQENIGKLTTYGKNVDDLLSVQFCKKVSDLIKSGNFINMTQPPFEEAQNENDGTLCNCA